MNRPFIAIVLGLAGFALYVAASVVLADQIATAHWAVQAIYFVIAGTAWVFPIRWLMLWSVHQR